MGEKLPTDLLSHLFKFVWLISGSTDLNPEPVPHFILSTEWSYLPTSDLFVAAVLINRVPGASRKSPNSRLPRD